MSTTILKRQYYRSSPLVNEGNNKVRVTLDMHILDWYLLRRTSETLAKADYEFTQKECDEKE